MYIRYSYFIMLYMQLYPINLLMEEIKIRRRNNKMQVLI